MASLKKRRDKWYARIIIFLRYDKLTKKIYQKEIQIPLKTCLLLSLIRVVSTDLVWRSNFCWINQKENTHQGPGISARPLFLCSGNTYRDGVHGALEDNGFGRTEFAQGESRLGCQCSKWKWSHRFRDHHFAWPKHLLLGRVWQKFSTRTILLLTKKLW